MTIDSAEAIRHFDRAIQDDDTNWRAYLGAGIASAMILDEPAALGYWREGNIEHDLLCSLGRHAQNQGLP